MDGNVYVLHGGNRVERYNGVTGRWIDQFISNAFFSEAKDMVFNQNGDLFVSTNQNNCSGPGDHGKIMAFSGKTGALLGDAVPCLAGAASGLHRLSEVMALAFSPRDGILYVGNDASGLQDSNLNSIARVGGRPYNVLKFRITKGPFGRYASSFAGVAVSSESHYIYDPNGMAFDSEGNLYISWEDCRYGDDNCAGAITRVEEMGQIADIVTGQMAETIGFTEGSGIRVSSSQGRIYVGSGDTGEIFVFDLAKPSHYFSFNSLNDPKGVASAFPLDWLLK